MLESRTTVLILTAAIGYVIATIGMKLASDSWSPVAITLICVGFFSAALAEIVLMRGIDLGVLYLIIIAVETLAVMAYAFNIGEGLNPRQALGGLFVLFGLAIVSH